MKKQFQMLAALLIAFTIFTVQTNAQSAFKRMPKPNNYSLSATTVNPTITAYRFTPMAGYNLKTQQVMAGIGFGPEKMHYVDSTQTYYTTFSIKLVGWVNGTTVPTLNPPNFGSGGIMFGFLNEAIHIGWAFNPPTSTPGSKWQSGPVINFGVALH